MDNLIIMQNFDKQETHIIDIKSEKEPLVPFCFFWNSMKETLPTVSLKLRAIIEKPKIVVQTKFFYDNKPISLLSEYIGIETLQGLAIESPMVLNKSLIYVDSDICVDTKLGRCYKLQFNPLVPTEKHPDRIESILFLFRRTGYRPQAFDYLKESIKKYLPLSEISKFFFIINKNYKQAIIEKHSVNRQSIGSKNDLYNRKLSINLEPELKIEDGMVVLFQSDMFSVIFQALFEENLMKTEYLAAVVEEYCHSLVNLDIEVQSSLQLLLARMLVKSGNWIRLESLLIYHTFSDSYELVNFLIQLIPTHYNALQFSVDMLFRIRHFEKLVDVMLDKDFVYESLTLLAKVSYPRFDIRKLLAKCEEIGDEQLTIIVTQFIKEKSLS